MHPLFFGHANARLGLNDCGCSALAKLPQVFWMTQHCFPSGTETFNRCSLFHPRWDIDQWVVRISRTFTQPKWVNTTVALERRIEKMKTFQTLWTSAACNRSACPLRHWSSKPALSIILVLHRQIGSEELVSAYAADIRRVLKTNSTRLHNPEMK